MPGIAIHYINLGVACDRQLKLAGYPTQGARVILLFALAIASYLIGAIPFGFIAGWLKGVDLRAVGSGNIGATNAARVLGKKWGYAVFALDFGKGALGAFLGRLALNDEMPASLPLLFAEPPLSLAICSRSTCDSKAARVLPRVRGSSPRWFPVPSHAPFWFG